MNPGHRPTPLIVSRQHADFAEYLKKIFGGDEGVQIIIDRRFKSRGPGAEAGFIERRKTKRPVKGASGLWSEELLN